MAGVVKLQQMLECPKCLKLYTDPQILNCQHTVCLNCVNDIKTAETDVTCPVCDVTSKIDDVKRDINKEQLLLVCSAENEEDQKHDGFGGEHLDEPVDDVDSEAEADQQDRGGPKCELCDNRIAWFCAQCQQWFCSQCKGRHVKTTATKYHKLEHLNKIAKKHRAKLEAHYFTIKRAHDRVSKFIGNVDGELLNADTTLGAALFTTKEMRTEWINRINHYFDTLDAKIAEFASTRILDLKRLRDRIEDLQTDLAKKTVYLSDFMTQYASVIVSSSLEVCRDMANYITDTQIPTVEIKPFNVKVTKGKPFDGRQIATAEMYGAHTVVSVPLAPEAYINHRQDIKLGQKKPKAVDTFPKQAQKTPRKGDDSFGSQGSVNQNTPRRTPVPKGRARKTPVNRTMALLSNVASDREKAEKAEPVVTKADAISQFTKSRLRRDGEVILTGKPSSIRWLEGKLWVAQENCITLWNTELEETRVVQHQLMKKVNAVSPLRRGGYIVASDSGLHLLAKTYKYDGRITDEGISDVVTDNYLVYAAHFKEKVRVRINVYDERVADWTTTQVIRTAIPGKVTLMMVEDKLYVCSMELGTVHIMTQTGEILRRVGKKGKFGAAGELFEPKLCNCDFENTILLCDVKNENYQILPADDKWGMIALHDTITAPSGGCFVRRNLFALQSGAEHKLIRYEG